MGSFLGRRLAHGLTISNFHHFDKMDIKKEYRVSKVSCTQFWKLLKKKNGGSTAVSDVLGDLPTVSLPSFVSLLI